MQTRIAIPHAQATNRRSGGPSASGRLAAHLRPAAVMIAAFTLVTGVAYPLAVTGLARIAMPGAAGGSLIERNGAVVGSALVGRSFTSPRYFHGRRSATVAQDPTDTSKTVDQPYNAANSAGSNLGPTSKALLARVEADIAAMREGAREIPADAVTASASGLDPHISPAFAAMQVARVAAARGVPQDSVRAILARHVLAPTAGVIGEPRVNVLELNLALDTAF